MFAFDFPAKIIGVGDFGAKLVDYSIAANTLLGISFTVVATNNKTLLKSSAPQKIKIEDAAEKSAENFSKIVANVELLFIATDLEDENISMQIAEAAKEILTVAVLPSAALNKKIFEKFQAAVDIFVAVENENLDLMFSVVRGVNNFITAPNMIGYDFADLSTILKNGGKAYVAHGKAKGENAFIDAAKIALDSMKDILADSKRILLGFFGEKEYLKLSFPDINKATAMIQDAAFKDAEILLGIVADVTDFNSAEVIIIATDNFNS